MNENDFNKLMNNEINELSYILNTNFPIPNYYSTRSLIECLDELLNNYGIICDSQDHLYSYSNNELLKYEEKLIKKQEELKNYIILLQKDKQQKQIKTNYPSSFNNKSITDIIKELEKLKQQTKQTSIELEIEQIQEYKIKKTEKQINEFKELAESLINMN